MISLITQLWVFVFMCSTPLHQPGNHGRLFRMAVTWPVLFWIIKYTWALTHTHRNSHLLTHTHTQTETLIDTLALLCQTVSRLKSFSHFRMKQEWGSQFPAMYNEPTHTPTVPTSTHTQTYVDMYLLVWNMCFYQEQRQPEWGWKKLHFLFCVFYKYLLKMCKKLTQCIYLCVRVSVCVLWRVYVESIWTYICVL